MMYAYDPAINLVIFETIKDLIPPRPQHPLGCHRKRVDDIICFTWILHRLVTGASWETLEIMSAHAVSDTTLRARRDEWVNAGIFEQLAAQALAGYHRLIGLDLSDVCIDGSDHLAPCGGEGAGHGIKHPGRLSWKWCMAVDADGIPIAWIIDAGNRNDYAMFFPVLDQLADHDWIRLIGAMHADRGFNYTSTPDKVAAYGIDNFIAPPRNKPDQGTVAIVGLGRRWIVEAANSWLCAYGQLRRNTDRKPEHRHAALCFAIALFITHRLRDPKTSPIR
jgi:Transposase DDE domain